MIVSSKLRKINALGAVALAAYTLIAALSYAQAAALWAPDYYPQSAEFFTRLLGAGTFAAIHAFFKGPLAVILLRWVPVIVATAAAIGLIAILRHADPRHDALIARRVMLWALFFAAVSFFAYPVYTQDFWLSAVWGQMTGAGINPYHVKFSAENIGKMPLDHFPMTMSYGPLWALLSSVVMAMAGDSILLAAVFFKVVLTAAWCATLFAVSRLAAIFSPGQRAVALAIAGWLPLGVLQTVAEGHNDVFLVLPVLLWLMLLLRNVPSAPLMLGVSVLCKYITAPLFLVDMLHALRRERMPFIQYCVRMVLPAIMFLGLMALFYRSFAFFDGLRLIGTWHFMHPDDAFKVIAGFVGDWIEPAGTVLLLIFPAVAVYQIWQYWRAATNENAARLTLAIMCALTFSGVSHLWPWYLVWTLPLAALIPQWWLSRFVVGMCLVAPFAVIVWWVPEAEEFNNLAALLLYAAAALWAYVTSSYVAVRSDGLPENVEALDVRRRAADREAGSATPDEKRIAVRQSA